MLIVFWFFDCWVLVQIKRRFEIAWNDHDSLSTPERIMLMSDVSVCLPRCCLPTIRVCSAGRSLSAAWLLVRGPCRRTRWLSSRRSTAPSTSAPTHFQLTPFLLTFLIVQIARKVGCWRTDENEMIACLKMSDPVGLTMAGKIDVMLILGKGEKHRFSCVPVGVYNKEVSTCWVSG